MTHRVAQIAVFAACVLAIGAGVTLPPAAEAQISSTFQNSCDHAFVDGDALVASCRRVDGSFRRTSIALAGIENIDGTLRFTQPGRPASFQDSCRHIHVVGSTILAACRRMDGSYGLTQIEIPAIENVDGRLQYALP
jgi:hypothetical protein